MSTELRIAEVAERAGITTATVRYYERIGVLPPAPRGPNGYRRYEQHTVERLAFIGRAKQLGCTLEEITDLATAWDGGRCGPVQDRLRNLVTAKLTAAQSEIAELVTLTTELRRAAATLETHRPDGACDERCGCLNQPSAPETVTLTPKPVTTPEVPAACTLDADRARERVDAWNRLLHSRPGVAGAVTSRQPITNGLRIEFATDVDIATLTQLAIAERDCCRFFHFAITVDHRGIGLEISAPSTVHTALTALFGAAQ